MPPIVLASTSPYRRELLARLRLAFTAVAPGVDEAPLPGEAPAATAQRLARLKACAVARRQPTALVIGSDQVAEIDGAPLNKPGTHAAALAQLQRLQGRSATFYTALALASAGGAAVACELVPTRVRFRTLDDAALDAYLRLDQPYDCAGAAKIESLGIALVEAVDCPDPTALIGLPLIALVSMLARHGVRVLPA